MSEKPEVIQKLYDALKPLPHPTQDYSTPEENYNLGLTHAIDIVQQDIEFGEYMQMKIELAAITKERDSLSRSLDDINAAHLRIDKVTP